MNSDITEEELEIATRANYESTCRNAKAQSGHDYPQWHLLSEQTQGFYRTDMRAALEAIGYPELKAQRNALLRRLSA